MCECRLERETVQHYFLNCSRFAAKRSVLLTSAAQLGQSWIESGDSEKLIENNTWVRRNTRFISNVEHFRPINAWLLLGSAHA
jgi:hypothetical protein